MSGLTADLLDAVEGVLEGGQGAGAALAPVIRGHAELKLAQGPEQLALSLHAGRVIAAAAAGAGGVLLRAAPAQQAVCHRAAWRRWAMGV